MEWHGIGMWVGSSVRDMHERPDACPDPWAAPKASSHGGLAAGRCSPSLTAAVAEAGGVYEVLVIALAVQPDKGVVLAVRLPLDDRHKAGVLYVDLRPKRLHRADAGCGAGQDRVG